MTKKEMKEQEELLKEGDGWECYRFASDVKGADIEKLQARVLKIGCSWDCYMFARHVKGADIKSLEKRAFKSRGA